MLLPSAVAPTAGAASADGWQGSYHGVAAGMPDCLVASAMAVDVVLAAAADAVAAGLLVPASSSAGMLMPVSDAARVEQRCTNVPAAVATTPSEQPTTVSQPPTESFPAELLPLTSAAAAAIAAGASPGVTATAAASVAAFAAVAFAAASSSS